MTIRPQEEPVSIGLLDFDKENPRYAPYHNLGKATDVEIVRYLSLTADLRELIQSVAANGYINVEPLIVTKNPKQKNHFIVLEGNRRLAALRVLRDKDFAVECGLTNLPELDKKKRATLDEVYITLVGDREEARSLIGFKHINGPQRWDSFAKARFAMDWYKEEKDIKKIANSLGDGHSTIKRLVFGILVLEQAVKNNLFDIEDRYNDKRLFAFSHLYTALSKAGYQKYLDMQEAWKAEEPPLKPVKEKDFKNLKQLLLWLYGSLSDGVQPVIKSQNPDLKKLNDVLTVAKATKTLINKMDLDKAYQDVQPPLELFEKSLIEAHKSAEDAISRMSAYEHAEETLVEIATTLAKNADLINKHVKSFSKK